MPLRLLAMVFLLLRVAVTEGGQHLRVMSFNAWGAGLNTGQDISGTVEVLRAASADLIGLQEVRAEAAVCRADDCDAAGESTATRLAQALGYHLIEQEGDPEVLWANAILSRYPIVAGSPGGLGARVRIGDTTVALFNLHLTDYPYQPYQATGIPYGDAPMLARAEELVEAAGTARGPGFEVFKADLLFAAGDAVVFVTGDFNEPSHRDWTTAAVSAGRHPLAVAYPTVMAFEALGFVDGYRSAYPDEVAHPGFTWTPMASPDTHDEHHDRIDYVLVHGARVSGAWVVGESEANADIVVKSWPSDHRAVVVEVELED